MNAMAADDMPAATDVLVADTVLAQLDALDPPVQQIVARTIQTVGRADGAVPFSLTVPDSPPGAQYLALSTPDPNAPVIIYREITPAETSLNGRWLVTTLLSVENYLAYKQLQQRYQQELPGDVAGAQETIRTREVAGLLDAAVRAVK
jgi:hypothetical protein